MQFTINSNDNPQGEGALSNATEDFMNDDNLDNLDAEEMNDLQVPNKCCLYAESFYWQSSMRMSSRVRSCCTCIEAFRIYCAHDSASL